MKVIDKTLKQPKFQPITLEVTIESEDELLDLYHRLNRASAQIYSSNYHPVARIPRKPNDLSYSLFRVLCELVR
jgi:hypothetical protein